MRSSAALRVLMAGVVLAEPAATFTPTKQEACCQSVLQGRDDPANCAALRCIGTMGLGILIVALLPSTVLSALLARRLWRRFPGGNATGTTP